MTIKEWIYKKYSDADKNKPLIEKLIISRGNQSAEEIWEFTHPLEIKLTSPEAFCDMQNAVARIVKAITNREKIVIYGDFDADGVTSTSLLYKTLKFLGAEVNYFIPDREKEGHGFESNALINLMKNHKPKLIISVDCGISNVKEVAFIKSFGVDVIITDHHEAPEVLPDATAIINPKAPNALSEDLSARQIYSLASLAGVGVAFKLAQALLCEYKKTEFVNEILPFVAVGTVADVVPLIGENRYFVSKGINLISEGKHYGLKRLLESAGYPAGNGLTSEIIAFGIAPRINASGRLETVEASMKLLISENPQEIEMAVVSLNELNKIRQKLCQDIFEQADEMAQKEDLKNSPAIILFNSEWPVGIIGIVASKLVEKYYKPVFLMTYSEETNQIKCSARSIEGVHLYEATSMIGELLDGFGGHALAAGLTFSPQIVPYKNVKEKLNAVIKEMVQGKVLKPFINIDMELKPEDISEDFVRKLSELEPFGASNPVPVFSLSDCILEQKKLMGDSNNHLRMTLLKEGYKFTAIRWQDGDIALNAGDSLDIVFQPQINTFNGNTSVQLIIKDIHSQKLNNESKPAEDSHIKIYDHRKKSDILPQVNDYVKTSKLDIRIFAENKSIVDLLSKYDGLKNKIFSRRNIVPCDAVMFFDYPADEVSIKNVIKNTAPSAIHLMNYDIKDYDEKDLIKVFSGMIKFAVNNTDGVFDLIRCAAFLGKSVVFVKSVLDLLEEASFISVEERREDIYRIKDVSIDNLSTIFYNPKYRGILEQSADCELFLKMLMDSDITELADLFELGEV